jgi:hypothetical protein
MTGRELANHRRRPNNKLPPAAERPIPRPVGCGIDKISYGGPVFSVSWDEARTLSGERNAKLAESDVERLIAEANTTDAILSALSATKAVRSDGAVRLASDGLAWRAEPDIDESAYGFGKKTSSAHDRMNAVAEWTEIIDGALKKMETILPAKTIGAVSILRSNSMLGLLPHDFLSVPGAGIEDVFVPVAAGDRQLAENAETTTKLTLDEILRAIVLLAPREPNPTVEKKPVAKTRKTGFVFSSVTRNSAQRLIFAPTGTGKTTTIHSMLFNLAGSSIIADIGRKCANAFAETEGPLLAAAASRLLEAGRIDERRKNSTVPLAEDVEETLISIILAKLVEKRETPSEEDFATTVVSADFARRGKNHRPEETILLRRALERARRRITDAILTIEVERKLRQAAASSLSISSIAA